MTYKQLSLPTGVSPQFVNQVMYARGSFMFPVNGAVFDIWETRADDPRVREHVRRVKVLQKIADGKYLVKDVNHGHHGLMTYDTFCQEAMYRDYKEQWVQTTTAVGE